MLTVYKPCLTINSPFTTPYGVKDTQGYRHVRLCLAGVCHPRHGSPGWDAGPVLRQQVMAPGDTALWPLPGGAATGCPEKDQSWGRGGSQHVQSSVNMTDVVYGVSPLPPRVPWVWWNHHSCNKRSERWINLEQLR